MDLARYLSLFVGEAAEHVAGLSRELVALEQAVRTGGDGGPLVDGIFRHVHSLKGMSASMQLDGIARLAHQAEDLVDLYRRKLARVEAPAVDALLATCDALQEMIGEAAEQGKPIPDPALMARLADATRRARDGRPAPTEPAPEAARAPIPVPDAPAAVAPAATAPESLSRQLVVEVEVAAACPVPAVRAFLVVKKLAAFGPMASCTPTVEELKAGRLPGKRLTVVL